jgi:hypothetical protein
VFAFPNVFHLFAHKLASLSAGRFAFAFVFARSFDWFFFWHNKMVSPLEGGLDVKKAAGVTSRHSFGSGKPILSSALLAAALLTAAFLTALLTATLFFTLALLTFTVLSLAILLLSLLSRAGGFARFIWVLFCVHDAFLYYSIRCLGHRTSRLHLCNQNRRGNRFGLKHTIGVADDCLIRQNPMDTRSPDLVGDTLAVSKYGRQLFHPLTCHCGPRLR